MKKYDRLQFRNPPNEYSIAPFYFLNGDLNDAELIRQIAEMKDKGVDEVILHSRKGVEVEYLSDEWFAKIGVILKELKKLSMTALIYDEDNWPSGYAGGKVTSENPDYAAICLSVDKIYPVLGEYITVEDKPSSEIECVIAVHSDDYFFDITDYEKKTNKPWKSETLQWEVFVFRKEKCGHRPAYSPFPYVDLLNPNATRSFVRHTHEEYKKRFPEEWGSVIRGFFTDEPGFYHNYLEQCKNLNTVIWTDDFAKRFIEKFGYDIRPHLCCLWQNMGSLSVRTRCDYYKAVAEFYKEGYFDVISDFLHKDGLIHVGHLHREDFIDSLVQTESDFFSAINALDASGIDCIDPNPGRITEKLGSSAAHIYGKEICFSETFGGFGWSLTTEDMKRRVDLQYVQGVNALVPHAFFYSTDGIRKTESPPSLFVQNGYWKYFRQFADYAKRLSYICRNGNFIADAAVYFPVKTAWAEYRPLYRFFLQGLDEQVLTITEELNRNGISFDFIDDNGLDKCRVADKALVGIEKSAYKAVILPSVTVIPEKTLVKIKDFVLGGGIVISAGKFEPTDETGERSEEFVFTLNELKNSDNYAEIKKHREDEILPVIKSVINGEIVSGDAGGVFTLKRTDGDTEIRFFVNADDKEKSFTVRQNGEYSAEIMNAENGDIFPADFARKNGDTEVKIVLRPFASVIVAFTDENLKPVRRKREKLSEDITFGWTVAGEDKTVEKADFFSAGKERFSGEVTFVKRINVSNPTGKIVLRAENVTDYASLSVNGDFAGARLWSPFEFDLTGKLRCGENEIALTIGSTEENAMTDGNKNAGVFGKIGIFEVK